MMLTVFCCRASTNGIPKLDYFSLESAIRASSFILFQQAIQNANPSQQEKMALLQAAVETEAARNAEINNHNTKVVISTGLKIFVPGVVFPIIGFYLDQRGLGILLAATSLAAGIGATIGAGVMAAGSDKGIMGRTIIVGIPIAATALATYGSIKLEKYFWQRAREISQKLYSTYDNAVKIKNYLTMLFADETKK